MTTKQRDLFNDVTDCLKEDVYTAYHRGVYLYGGRLRTAKSMPNFIAVVNISDGCYKPYAFRKHNDLTCMGSDNIIITSNNLTFCKACGGIMDED
jgi:hypothetical protein